MIDSVVTPSADGQHVRGGRTGSGPVTAAAFAAAGAGESRGEGAGRDRGTRVG